MKLHKSNALNTALLSALIINFAIAIPAPWSYDPGPRLQSKDAFEAKMARELVDLNARIANAPAISEEVVGRQRFRPAYGPIPWRMLLKPNSVKILFIGQDGTHIAEAANRPATAGFGGRAQDLARYFGVNESAAFMNNYAFTINGQYNTANTPYIDQSNPNTPKVFTTTFTDNKFWLVSQDQDSPVTQWRNDLIEWVIRNNPDTLQLIVAFGGAAKDGISAFVKSRKGNAKGRLELKMNSLQVAETKIVGAGSNKQFSLLIDGKAENERRLDLFQNLNTEKKYILDDDGNVVRFDYTNVDHQNAVLKMLKENLADFLPRMVFTGGGAVDANGELLNNNGILDAAQLGGYDMEKLSVTSEANAETTISLKGLELSTGEKISRDVLVVQLPHPTALSMMTPDDASETVKERLKILEPYKSGQHGERWRIKPDFEIEPSANNPGKLFVNNFDPSQEQILAANPYRYARSDISPAYYDFGTPASRMVSVSSASRMSGAGNSHIIVFGSRDRGAFPTSKLKEITDFKFAEEPNKENFYTTRPRSKDLLDVFDPGPNVLDENGDVKINYAQIMKENLNFDEIYRMKPAQNGQAGELWDKEKRAHQEMPISQFNIKSHPMVADFGHYRGTFNAPKVIILADPHGYDDMVTSRALTGERGQYLQSLMRNIGVPVQYLVIKTVPFGMDNATGEEWTRTLEVTQNYRKAIFDKLLSENTGEKAPLLAISDGPQAQKLLPQLLGGRTIPVVNIKRDSDPIETALTAAATEIKTKVPSLNIPNAPAFVVKRANIPREHLTYYARIWEGTSGDRVLNSAVGDELNGIAFAEIAPRWAWEQKFPLTPEESRQVAKLKQKLVDGKLPQAGESILESIERLNVRPGLPPTN